MRTPKISKRKHTSHRVPTPKKNLQKKKGKEEPPFPYPGKKEEGGREPLNHLSAARIKKNKKKTREHSSSAPLNICPSDLEKKKRRITRVRMLLWLVTRRSSAGGGRGESRRLRFDLSAHERGGRKKKKKGSLAADQLLLAFVGGGEEGKSGRCYRNLLLGASAIKRGEKGGGSDLLLASQFRKKGEKWFARGRKKKKKKKRHPNRAMFLAHHPAVSRKKERKGGKQGFPLRRRCRGKERRISVYTQLSPEKRILGERTSLLCKFREREKKRSTSFRVT